MIVSLHVTHRSAGDISGLEQVLPSLESNIEERIGRLAAVEEYVIVRTCNRFELYTSTHDRLKTREALEEVARRSMPFGREGQTAFVLEGDGSVGHLFRVVCGLDSLIVGEDQIQHQIRKAYADAKGNGHANGLLARLFDRALAVGKRVRSETALNRGAVSVGSAAVELAEQRLGTLEGKTVTVLGAGDMASVIAANLAGRGPHAVFVSNRTFGHARELAEHLGGTAVSFDRKTDAVGDSDLVLVATGAPHPVIRRPDVEAAMAGRGERRLLMIDVSLPRNIDDDVGEVAGVTVETMDSLRSIAMENVARRKAEISRAERIINDELARIERERREKAADEVIRRIGLMFAGIRECELTRAKARALADPDIDSILDDLSRALVNNISSELFINLRKASREGDVAACETVRLLFGLED